MYNNNEFNNKTVKKVKLVLLGNSAAGKTCIVQRIVNNMFNANNSSTIGAAYTIYNVESNIKVEIWDTAGQERFYSLLPMYARGAEIILVVIDVEKNIDEQFIKWNAYIQDNNTMFSPYFKLFLLFNKYDLNPRFEIPETIMSQTQFSFVTLVSAKTAHNIDKLKTHVEITAKKIIDEHACASHEYANIRRRNNRGNSSNSSNDANANANTNTDANAENDTIFGSTFSNMDMKIRFSEYRDKVKKYYEYSHC
jgi:small GTP-binding protein